MVCNFNPGEDKGFGQTGVGQTGSPTVTLGSSWIWDRESEGPSALSHYYSAPCRLRLQGLSILLRTYCAQLPGTQQDHGREGSGFESSSLACWVWRGAEQREGKDDSLGVFLFAPTEGL